MKNVNNKNNDNICERKMYIANAIAKNIALNIFVCFRRLLKPNISHASIAEITINVILNIVPPKPIKKALKIIIIILDIKRKIKLGFLKLSIITLKLHQIFAHDF